MVMAERMANMIGIVLMARRPDHKKAEVLSDDDLKQLRRNLATSALAAFETFMIRHTAIVADLS
jgi:hypothetical protein